MIKLRNAQQFDISQLVKWSLALAEHEKKYNQHTFIDYRPDFEQKLNEWLTSMIAAPHCLVNIAEIDSKPKGFSLGLLVQSNNPFSQYTFHGVIQLLWVEPKYRRHGLANRLVDQQETFLKGLQASYIDIQYSHNNQLAESFWSAHGFEGAIHTLRKFF